MLQRSDPYPGLRGKIVDRVEHAFEDGLLFIHVHFSDHTELCWEISSRLTIARADLQDWTTDLNRLRTFVRNSSDSTRR
jgi:hypothetical protein